MKVPIDSIVVGERRRVEMGDIDELARSITRWGLIHPIVVDDAWNLIAGGRRLAACKRLGRTEVDVRSHGTVSVEDRGELEREENVQRKDLTPAEASRQLLDRAATTEQLLLQARHEDAGTFGDDRQKSRMGRPLLGEVPAEAIANHIGVARSSLRVAKAHVEAVARYPELGHPRVRPKEAIRVAAELDEMVEIERASVLAAIAARPTDYRPSPRVRRAPEPPVRKAPRPKRTLAGLPSTTRFVRCLRQLEEALSVVLADGGLMRGLASWPAADREAQLADVRGLAERLCEAALEEAIP